jgi:hypothetical protein
MNRRPLRRRGFGTTGSWEISEEELRLKFNEERAKGYRRPRAFMNIMAQYNMSIDHLQTCASRFLAHQIANNLGQVGSFSKADYNDVAHFFGLDSVCCGDDILDFELPYVYLTNEAFEHVIQSLTLHQGQFGGKEMITNEIGVLHYITAVYTPYFVDNTFRF